MEPLWIWVISLIAVFIGIFGTANAVRYYQYQSQLKTTGGPTGTEVYWINPQFFDPILAAYTAPNPLKDDSKKPINGSGYYAYATAYNTGLLATYFDLYSAYTRGMTVDHWGFFDGECGDQSPSTANPRGRLCAINCCSPSPSVGGKKQNCKVPSVPVPIPGCSGNTASSSTGQCSPCYSPDANIDIKFGPVSPGTTDPYAVPAAKFSLSTCSAWYAEEDGLFVACPQSNPSGVKPTTIPKIPGGPWDADGNTIESGGPGQPGPSTKPSVNAYQINSKPTIDFGGKPAPSEFNQLSGPTKWNFRMGYETVSPSSSLETNPWAGAFVVGVKPPKGTPGVLPFDVTGSTPDSNNGWNDPNAITSAPPPPAFQLIPDSQIILFLIIAAAVAFIFGVMWFRSTRLGQSLLYWI